MRSLIENKRLILLLAILALGALTVLAISLNEIPFRPGQRFVRPEAAQPPPPAAEVAQVWVRIPLWHQLIVWTLLALLLVLIGLLLSPEMRKRMLLLLIRVGFTMWAIYFLFKNYGDQLFGFNLQRPDAPQLDGVSVVPMPVFEAPQVSPAFSYVISFAFALILLVVVWLLYRGWQRYAALNKTSSLDEIAKIARSSLNDLSSGRNSSDVIINCYLRMSDVVSHKRQLHREIAMTPHEFALRLEQAGLPGDAVTRLTRLFEGVRYGDRKSGPKDVNEAVSCLKTILHYCGEPV
jgi:Domain of unknown function (DUF4129)